MHLLRRIRDVPHAPAPVQAPVHVLQPTGRRWLDEFVYRGRGSLPGLAVTLGDLDQIRGVVAVTGRAVENVGPRRAEQYSPAERDDLIADQPERSGLGAERNHRGVALEIPDHIGE